MKIPENALISGRVSFEYLQMKEKSQIGRGGVWTLNKFKGTPTLNQKKTHMSFRRESSCLQGVRTLHVFPCYKNLKRTRYLSLFSSRLSTPQTSISLSEHFLRNPPRAHVTSLSLFTPCFSTPQNPLSLYLSLKAFFWQTHPKLQKNNHTYQNNSCKKPVLIS